MKFKKISLLSVLFGVVNGGVANSFEELAPHLELDGDFMAIMDFQGDGTSIANQLNKIYAAVLEAAPEVPPLPIDFNQVFDTLGFGSLRSVGFSSKAVEDGLFSNRIVYAYDGSPRGIYAMNLQDEIPFTAAERLPGDATLALSSSLDLKSFRQIVVDIMQQVMGPMGEAMVLQQTEQFIPGTDVSYDDLIAALSGNLDMGIKQVMGTGDIFQDEFSVWASFANAGSILARLKPLSEFMPITYSEDSSGLVFDLSSLIPENNANIGLYLLNPTGTDELVFYTDPYWTVEAAGSKLSESPDFQQLSSRLPEKAIGFSYQRGNDFSFLDPLLESDPTMANFKDVFRLSFDLILGDFLKPQINAVTYNDGILLNQQYAGFSQKQIVVILPAVILGGITAAAAIPAFQNVSRTSEEATIQNNLRMISAASQMYFLETGETEVLVGDLIEAQYYLPPIYPVAGENYHDMLITIDMDELIVTLPDGRVISLRIY